MIHRGVVRNGVVVPENPGDLPEGAAVRIELVLAEPESALSARPRRVGGWARGQIVLAPDFDKLPDDIAEAFGAKQP